MQVRIPPEVWSYQVLIFYVYLGTATTLVRERPVQGGQCLVWRMERFLQLQRFGPGANRQGHGKGKKASYGSRCMQQIEGFASLLGQRNKKLFSRVLRIVGGIPISDPAVTAKEESKRMRAE